MHPNTKLNRLKFTILNTHNMIIVKINFLHTNEPTLMPQIPSYTSN